MSFVISTVTAPSAVTNGGTLTFGYPSIPASGVRPVPSEFDPNKQAVSAVVVPASQTGPGDFYSASNHRAYSVGNQAALVYGLDFTLTFNAEASGITFTYAGSSTIPAGSVVNLQLELVGQDNGAVFKDDSRVARGCLAPVVVVRMGAPIALNATGILSAVADVVTTVVTLASPFVLDVPRGLSIKSSTTDTTQTITIRGFDEYGNAMTESIALNGTTGVNGLKAWKTVVSYQANIALAGNLSIGFTNVLGLPFLLEAKGYLLAEVLNGAKNTNTNVLLAGISGAVPTATTGDVRGTYAPATTLPNGANAYELVIASPDPTYLGLTQFAG